MLLTCITYTFVIVVAFNLDFYTDVLDLNYLLEHIQDNPFTQKYKKLNETLVGLVEDYGLVSFKTLDIQVFGTIMDGMLVHCRVTVTPPPPPPPFLNLLVLISLPG